MDLSGIRTILSLFIIVCFQSNYVSLFTMLSHNQQYIVDPGAQLTLKCEFFKEKFSLFNNPVQWKKFQYGEESEINILGNIKEPFDSTGRFQVSYEPSAPRYTMALTISDMQPIDSGNYTCDIRAPKSAPLGTVRYAVFVKTPVDEVRVVQGNSSTTDQSSVTSITLIENQPSPLRCIARGGSPPPDMEISIGREDYTKYFRFDSVPGVSGEVGFRSLEMTAMLVTDDFRAVARDDGKRLNCIAQVPGLTKLVSSARLIVNYAPRIECQSTTTHIGERNVRLTCDITARPELTSWYWVLDANGTTVSEGEITDGYWTVVTQRDGKVNLELYIRQITQHSFRVYKLVAENAVATTSVEVSLYSQYSDPDPAPHVEDNKPQREKHASDPQTLNSGNANISSTVIIITALVAILYVCMM